MKLILADLGTSFISTLAMSSALVGSRFAMVPSLSTWACLECRFVKSTRCSLATLSRMVARCGESDSQWSLIHCFAAAVGVDCLGWFPSVLAVPLDLLAELVGSILVRLGCWFLILMVDWVIRGLKEGQQ